MTDCTTRGIFPSKVPRELWQPSSHTRDFLLHWNDVGASTAEASMTDAKPPRISAEEGQPLGLKMYREAQDAQKKGDLTEALALFLASIVQSGYHPNGIYQAAWCLIRLGRPGIAMQMIDDILLLQTPSHQSGLLTRDLLHLLLVGNVEGLSSVLPGEFLEEIDAAEMERKSRLVTTLDLSAIESPSQLQAAIQNALRHQKGRQKG